MASEMGLESWDVRCLRRADITGAQLLLLSEGELMAATGLPRHKARRLRRLTVRGVTVMGWWGWMLRKLGCGRIVPSQC